jgi:hypothetical protein
VHKAILSLAEHIVCLPDSHAPAYLSLGLIEHDPFRKLVTAFRNRARKERIMSRLVRRPVVPDLDQQIAGLDSVLQSGIATMSVTGADPGDNYLERMVKYIPGEVLGFSLVINAILDQAIKSGGPNAAMAGLPIPVIATGALIVGMILTPLFCWYVRKDGDAWMLNAVVSTVAFPFWAYLMGAVAFANIHDGNLAVILVLTLTVVTGLVSPLPARPKAVEQQQAAPVERPRLVNALDVA